MSKTKNVSLLGDGIGQEISIEATKVLEWFNNYSDLDINIKEDLVGGVLIDKYGVPLTDETLKSLSSSDAILLGAVGGPKWESLDLKKDQREVCLKLEKN